MMQIYQLGFTGTASKTSSLVRDTHISQLSVAFIQTEHSANGHHEVCISTKRKTVILAL
jgi:hypothetical protein